MPAVSDTSPISNLAVIDRLTLLSNEFRKVYIPPAVADELSALSHPEARLRIENAVGSGWLALGAGERPN